MNLILATNMRAKSYVNFEDSRKAGTMYGHNWSSYDHAVSMLRVFDREIRLLAEVVPDADCMAGDCDKRSWFMAEFVVCGHLLVLTYDLWDDGCFWNLQRNENNGPEGIKDLRRYKFFGPMLKVVRQLVGFRKSIKRL